MNTHYFLATPRLNIYAKVDYFPPAPPLEDRIAEVELESGV